MTLHRLGLMLCALGLAAAPALAQGRGPKHYAVTNDRALVVTREVLVKQGYDVVRVENNGPDMVVWYRRGNMGGGRGEGAPGRVGIHPAGGHRVFLNKPSAIPVGIGVRVEEE